MHYFRATIDRYSNPIYGLPQLLLKDIVSNDELFRDHVWVKWSKRLSRYKFGDSIEFTAEVYDYISSEGPKKGLKHIRNIHAISYRRNS